jgi:hypothetical protein
MQVFEQAHTLLLLYKQGGFTSCICVPTKALMEKKAEGDVSGTAVANVQQAVCGVTHSNKCSGIAVRRSRTL